jgi:hypothetical protein
MYVCMYVCMYVMYVCMCVYIYILNVSNKAIGHYDMYSLWVSVGLRMEGTASRCGV